MWNVRLLVLAAAATVCVSGPPQVRGDERDEKKRLDEILERLRKAEPTEEYEVARKKANDQLVILLGKAESLELFRLDPQRLGGEPKDREKSFHGYAVALQTSVGPAARRAEVIKSLGEQLHWFEGWKALCFNPRHGLRAVAGKEAVDLVICLECHRMKVYRGGESEGEVVLIGSEWEPAEKSLREVEQKATGAAKK